MKVMVFVEVFAIVIISQMALGTASPQHKTLTGLLSSPYYNEHMATFTPDTSISSRGCVVEQRNGRKNAATNGVWEGEVVIDSWPFSVTICTRLPDMIKLSFILEQSPIKPCYDETTDVNMNSGMLYPCRNFVFCNGTKLGTLLITVSCDPNACPESNFEVFMEATFPASTIELVSDVATTNPIVGQPVTIVAKLQSKSSANMSPPEIISAVMRIFQGDGSEITEVMNVLLNNTVIGKFIPTFSDQQKLKLVDHLDQTIQIMIRFLTPLLDEAPMQHRTLTHIVYSVVESIFQRSKPSVAGHYTHPMTNSQMVKFTIPVRLLKSQQGCNYRYYTEVWGTDINGTEKPVCWISGLTDIQLDNTTEDDKYINGHFDIEMDSNWMIITQTLFPLHFRNFSVEETRGFVEVMKIDTMEIDHDPTLLMWTTNKRPKDVKITREMMEGYNPYNSEQATDSKLLLVHGYCSINEFPTDEFTNYAVFKDYGQSRDIDEFAQLIDRYAASQDINAYSIVAHSQGGMAALHLLTYYHSGLNNTTNGGRKIQTVGTPWQGTPLMGSIANIVQVFGFSCGYNEDITTQGASRWLSKIPLDKQKEVYYYTTAARETHRPCQFATQIILSNPNDGAVELKRSHLPGGTWVSHTLGECHTGPPLMTYPNQCHNATRNSEMNRLAAY